MNRHHHQQQLRGSGDGNNDSRSSSRNNENNVSPSSRRHFQHQNPRFAPMAVTPTHRNDGGMPRSHRRHHATAFDGSAHHDAASKDLVGMSTSSHTSIHQRHGQGRMVRSRRASNPIGIRLAGGNSIGHTSLFAPTKLPNNGNTITTNSNGNGNGNTNLLHQYLMGATSKQPSHQDARTHPSCSTTQQRPLAYPPQQGPTGDPNVNANCNIHDETRVAATYLSRIRDGSTMKPKFHSQSDAARLGAEAAKHHPAVVNAPMGDSAVPMSQLTHSTIHSSQHSSSRSSTQHQQMMTMVPMKPLALGFRSQSSSNGQTFPPLTQDSKPPSSHDGTSSSRAGSSSRSRAMALALVKPSQDSAPSCNDSVSRPGHHHPHPHHLGGSHDRQNNSAHGRNNNDSSRRMNSASTQNGSSTAASGKQNVRYQESTQQCQDPQHADRRDSSRDRSRHINGGAMGGRLSNAALPIQELTDPVPGRRQQRNLPPSALLRKRLRSCHDPIFGLAQHPVINDAKNDAEEMEELKQRVAKVVDETVGPETNKAGETLKQMAKDREADLQKAHERLMQEMRDSFASQQQELMAQSRSAAEEFKASMEQDFNGRKRKYEAFCEMTQRKSIEEIQKASETQRQSIQSVGREEQERSQAASKALSAKHLLCLEDAVAAGSRTLSALGQHLVSGCMSKLRQPVESTVTTMFKKLASNWAPVPAARHSNCIAATTKQDGNSSNANTDKIASTVHRPSTATNDVTREMSSTNVMHGLPATAHDDDERHQMQVKLKEENQTNTTASMTEPSSKDPVVDTNDQPTPESLLDPPTQEEAAIVPPVPPPPSPPTRMASPKAPAKRRPSRKIAPPPAPKRITRSQAAAALGLRDGAEREAGKATSSRELAGSPQQQSAAPSASNGRSTTVAQLPRPSAQEESPKKHRGSFRKVPSAASTDACDKKLGEETARDVTGRNSTETSDIKMQPKSPIKAPRSNSKHTGAKILPGEEANRPMAKPPAKSAAVGTDYCACQDNNKHSHDDDENVRPALLDLPLPKDPTNGRISPRTKARRDKGSDEDHTKKQDEKENVPVPMMASPSSKNKTKTKIKIKTMAKVKLGAASNDEDLGMGKKGSNRDPLMLKEIVCDPDELDCISHLGSLASLHKDTLDRMKAASRKSASNGRVRRISPLGKRSPNNKKSPPNASAKKVAKRKAAATTTAEPAASSTTKKARSMKKPASATLPTKSQARKQKGAATAAVRAPITKALRSSATSHLRRRRRLLVTSSKRSSSPKGKGKKRDRLHENNDEFKFS